MFNNLKYVFLSIFMLGFFLNVNAVDTCNIAVTHNSLLGSYSDSRMYVNYDLSLGSYQGKLDCGGGYYGETIYNGLSGGKSSLNKACSWKIGQTYTVKAEFTKGSQVVSCQQTAIVQGNSQCTNGQTKSCITSDNCQGTQICTNNQWGQCVKTNSSCGNPSNPPNQSQDCQNFVNNNQLILGKHMPTYDINKNGKLDDDEFLNKTIPDWNQSKIPNNEYFVLVDMWVKQCIYQGGGQCMNGQIQGCKVGSCDGAQICTLGQWGICVKSDPDCVDNSTPPNPPNPTNQSPVANFYWIPNNPNLGQKFTVFDNSTDDGAIVRWEWIVFASSQIKRNGTKTINLTVNKGNAVDVELTVTDNNGLKSTVKKTIGIVNNPSPIVNFELSQSILKPRTYIFDASKSTDDKGIEEYFWYLGDGTTSDKKEISHQYDLNGVYYVVLSVRDDSENWISTFTTLGVNVDVTNLQTTYKVFGLSPGWNSIFIPSGENIPLAGLKCGNMLVLKLENGKLTVEGQVLEAGRAYLIRTNQFCSLGTNVPKVGESNSLNAGWNLVGFGQEFSIEKIEEKCQNPLVIGLTPVEGFVDNEPIGGKLYQENDKISQNIGYLVRVANACQIN